MFNALEPWHLLIIVGVLVLLFGAKRLPNSARAIGRSMRIFRSEMADGRHDDTDSDTPHTDGTSAGPSAIRQSANFSAQPEPAAVPGDNVTASRA